LHFYLLRVGGLETATAYLQRGERIARTFPERVDVLNMALMKGENHAFTVLEKRPI
jgi:hypothetical protein